MVLQLYGNSEIDAHVSNNLCQLIFLRHLIRSKAGTSLIFLYEKTNYPSSSELPSNISNILPDGLFNIKE